MKIDGKCHCGEISFKAEVDAALFGICHCTDCQALTGSAFNASVTVPAAKFVLVSGNPKAYVKTAADGRKSHSMFCGNCGSRVYSYSESDSTLYRIRLGVIAQRATFTARGQIWRRSALPWVDSISSARWGSSHSAAKYISAPSESAWDARRNRDDGRIDGRMKCAVGLASSAPPCLRNNLVRPCRRR